MGHRRKETTESWKKLIFANPPYQPGEAKKRVVKTVVESLLEDAREHPAISSGNRTTDSVPTERKTCRPGPAKKEEPDNRFETPGDEVAQNASNQEELRKELRSVREAVAANAKAVDTILGLVGSKGVLSSGLSALTDEVLSFSEKEEERKGLLSEEITRSQSLLLLEHRAVMTFAMENSLLQAAELLLEQVAAKLDVFGNLFDRRLTELEKRISELSRRDPADGTGDGTTISVSAGAGGESFPAEGKEEAPEWEEIPPNPNCPDSLGWSIYEETATPTTDFPYPVPVAEPTQDKENPWNHALSEVRSVSSPNEPDRARKKVKMLFQVGIDFGNVFTKVICRNLSGNGECRALSLGSGREPESSFLFPSVLALTDNSNILTGTDAHSYLLDRPWGDGISHLKETFFDSSNGKTTKTRRQEAFERYLSGKPEYDRVKPGHFVALFFCKLFRQIRQRMNVLYPDFETELLYNVCLPSQIMKRAETCEGFRQAVTLAHDLHDNPDERPWQTNAELLERIRAAYAGRTAGGSPEAERKIRILKETASGVVPFLRSSVLKREGIQFIIDLGAGATDITMVVHGSSLEGLTSRWYGRNLPKGMSRIADKIAKAGKNLSTEEVLNRMAREDLMDDPSIGHFVGQEVKSLCDDIDETRRLAAEASRDDAFLKEEKNVTVLLAGGGACLPCIRKALTEELTARHSGLGFRSIPAPEISDDATLTECFGRLNVAYGLSFQEKEILGAESERCRPSSSIIKDDVVGYWHSDEGPEFWR